ncbi:MAG: 3-phosphoshikimate 1-carboxyvinyltransferase [Phycisphaerae bacterium]|nr:3-phosphoshikimate 1-carboxyvinyltransferase [Phycisphaerae bacterium]
MCALLLPSASGPVNAVVRLPGSKSITNRAMITAALAKGKSRLTGVLFADDTQHMIVALQRLGVAITADPDACTVEVAGCQGHLPASDAEIYCGNSGTTMRFCTALCALGFGEYVLDGTARMQERPIEDLVQALQWLGTPVSYLGREGYPPLCIHARGLKGGQVHFDSPPSSQMVSALLMAAPCARSDVMIEVGGQLVSEPYVRMTLAVMDAFEVTVLDRVESGRARYIVSAPQGYQARRYAIEPDASNASYFLAAPAVAGGSVTVEGLGTDSIQGDAHFVGILERMGCRIHREPHRLTVHAPPAGEGLRGIDVDLNHMPDMVQTVAVVALFAEGPTRLRNVANLRLKETDRLAALAHELGALGAKVQVHSDGLTVCPPTRLVPAKIETYDDHRMAMSFALASLRLDGVVIKEPACVSKTFPDFFERFKALL